MIKRILTLVAACAISVPASALITIQTKTVRLISLNAGPIISQVAFNPFSVAGQHLTSVELIVDEMVNGQVVAVNSATGGTAASRRRNVAGSYALVGGVLGNGLSALGVDIASQTKNIAGNGTVTVLNALNPSFIAADSISSGFAPFLSGPVDFTFGANAAFMPTPVPNVTYVLPTITGGRALISLIYESVVPEPATWGLLIVGFGMIGVAARYRRKAATAIAA